MQCRFCLGDEGDMISPCKCRGSIKWVHSECLENWFKNDYRNKEKCNSCKFKYEYHNDNFFREFFIEFLNLIIENIHCYAFFLVIGYLFFIFSVIVLTQPINLNYDYFLFYGSIIFYFHFFLQVLSLFLINNFSYFNHLNYFGIAICLFIQSIFFYLFYINPFSFLFLHGFIASWYQYLVIHLNTIKSLQNNLIIKSLSDEEIRNL